MSFAQAYAHMLSLWPALPTSQDRNGTRYQLWGKGPPLVLLHGMKVTSASWSSLAGPLGEHFSCRAVDTPGDCGFSSGRPKSLDSLLEWLAEVVGEDHPHIVGMSYGGWLGLEFALRWPQRIGRLALIAPAGLMSMNPQFIWRGLPMLLWPRRSFVDAYLRWAAVPSPDPRYEGWMNALVDVMHQGLREGSRALMPLPRKPVDVRGLKTPTLLILGEEEKIYSPHPACDRVSGVMQTRLLPNASHDIIYAQAGAVSQEILTFLQ